MKFCDNPICRCHVEAPEHANRLSYTEANGGAVVTARHTVHAASAPGHKPKIFSFCDTCVKAVAMVNCPDDSTTEQPKTNER